MQRQLQQAEDSLIRAISDSHAACLTAAKDIGSTILIMVNKARACGEWLSQLKQQTPYGKWQGMFANRGGRSETHFTFTYETARNYMRFAAANPEEITELTKGIRSLKDAMIASGALPAPSFPSHQQFHQTQENLFVSLTRPLIAFRTTWAKQKTLHPIESWARDSAMQFVEEFRPIVDEVNDIYSAAKARALEGDSGSP